MAVRKTFFLKNNKIAEMEYTIKWHPGFSFYQKEKNVLTLHNAIVSVLKVTPEDILEVSTKSNNALGRSLSSFNLFIKVGEKKYNLESVYQSSKVFTTINGEKQYIELLQKDPWEAKKAVKDEDPRCLSKFRFFDRDFPIKPKHLFYDWLYIKALNDFSVKYEDISKYKFFTDIEFNPLKSVNCQARTLVLYLWLQKNGKMEKFLQNPRDFYNNEE